MVYLIFEILWFLVAAAGLGLVVGWLCRSLAPRRPEAASRTPVRDGQGVPREQLEERLAEALDGGKALHEELAQVRQSGEAEFQALRRREQEQRSKLEALDGGKALQEELAQVRQAGEAELQALRQREREQRSKLEAREAEVARLSAELEARRAQFAMPLPPDTVSSPLTPGPLEVAEPEGGAPPDGLAAPQGAADDLKRINGVGQSIERALHQNGIFHYRQIAGLSPPNVVWLDHHLRLKGRLEREDWIGQAKALLADGDPAGEDLAEPGPLTRQK